MVSARFSSKILTAKSIEAISVKNAQIGSSQIQMVDAAQSTLFAEITIKQMVPVLNATKDTVSRIDNVWLGTLTKIMIQIVGTVIMGDASLAIKATLSTVKENARRFLNFVKKPTSIMEDVQTATLDTL